MLYVAVLAGLAFLLGIKVGWWANTTLSVRQLEAKLAVLTIDERRVIARLYRRGLFDDDGGSS